MSQHSNFLEPGAPELITASSHAERNPGLVQPSRKREKIGKAQKTARIMQNQIIKEKRRELISDLDKIMTDHSSALEDLAKKHSVKVDYVQKLITNAPTFKKKRIPSLHNAMVHAKAMEINDGNEYLLNYLKLKPDVNNLDVNPGDRKKLPELHKLVAADADLQNLDDEEKKELLDELVAHRKLKQAGAWPSNRSAATDYRGVVDNLATEFQHLADRTGACAVAFLSRGHLDDTFEPVYICLPNAGNFVNDALNMGPSDVACLLEQWACSVARKKEPTDMLVSMRAEVSALILQGLKAAAQTSKISMNYINYDRQIVESYGVKLIGWPCEKFVSPKEISTVDEIRTIRDAFRVGTCKWVRMSKLEVQHHMKDYEKRLENGEITKKQQKERSDKGSKRKQPQREDGDSESSAESGAEERPPKKTRKKKGKENSAIRGPVADARGRQTKRGAKAALNQVARKKLKAQLPPAPSRSKSIISDSDFDSESDLRVSQNTAETEASRNNCNATPCTATHTSSVNLPAAPSTNLNDSAPTEPSLTCIPAPSCTTHPDSTAINTPLHPDTVVPHNAPSSIVNDSQTRPLPATLPPHHLHSAFRSADNAHNLPTHDLLRSAGSIAGLDTAIPQDKHHYEPTHFSRPAQDVQNFSGAIGSTFMPTAFNASFPSCEVRSQLYTPFIPTRPPSRQPPAFEMTSPSSAGLSLPTDMLPHGPHFSSQDNSFYMPLPSSSGLTLPPDMLPYNFSTPIDYDLSLHLPYDNRYRH